MTLFPRRGWIGLFLILVFWTINWAATGLRTHLGFFPLWLGYILFVDALVFQKKQSSLWQRGKWAFVSLFILSVPVWWVFEVINWRTKNWVYIGREQFTALQFFLLASLSFSTVIPAVFETAELASTFKWMTRVTRGPRISTKRPMTQGIFLLGIGLLTAIFIWPTLFYPFLWISLFLIVEPLNVWLKRNSVVLGSLKNGNWSAVFSLASGGLICGFFWEMWNYFSYPKWGYHLPHVNFLKVFEMPVLGYMGYVPFSLELFAIYHLFLGAAAEKKGSYLRILPGEQGE